MAKEKKLVESITARDVDFAQWYTDVVREAKLCDYSGVKAASIIFRTVMQSGKISRKIWMRVLKKQDRERISSGVDPGSAASERKGSYRRICTGGCMGNTRRNRTASRKILHPADIGDVVL